MIPRDMTAYGLASCLRITVGLEEENRRMVASLAGLAGRRRAA